MEYQKKYRRGSLTVEASACVPFFFLCVTALISALTFYADIAEKTLELQERAEKRAAAAAVLSDEEDCIIDISETLNMVPAAAPFALPSVSTVSRGRVRAWTGYTADDGAYADDEDVLVYVTDYESVYHTSSSCTHLDLSWEAVPLKEAEIRINHSGGHYHACEKCVGEQAGNSVVYISEHGDSYHNSASCSGLTRHVRLVKKSRVRDRQICSRCAAAGGD